MALLTQDKLAPDKLAANDPQKPVVEGYTKAFMAKYKTDVSAFGGYAYDGLGLAVDAIKRAGGTDSAKLKDAINSTKGFAGVTGTITLDASRNAVKPAVVLELTPAESKFTFKETIYPEGMTPPTK